MKKYIKNSKNYYVTSSGDVYSGDKKLSLGKGDYYRKVRIGFKDGIRKDCLVHRLVAEAFIPNPDNKPVVNHKDGVKSNNKVDNLEWVTYSENNEHAVRTGLTKTCGFNTANADYTEAQIRSVLKLMQDGLRYKNISEITGVSYQHIINIRNGNRHKELSKEYDLPPPRSKTLSWETVEWICKKLDEGFSDKEIEGMSNNPHVNQTKIRFIRTGYTFTEISKKYNFRKNT